MKSGIRINCRKSTGPKQGRNYEVAFATFETYAPEYCHAALISGRGTNRNKIHGLNARPTVAQSKSRLNCFEKKKKSLVCLFCGPIRPTTVTPPDKSVTLTFAKNVRGGIESSWTFSLGYQYREFQS